MKLTALRRERFLARLRLGSSVTHAAKGIKVSTVALYELRKNDPTFAALWLEAVESGTDVLEDTALKRAKSTSDSLLMFLLKGRRPDKFRDRVDAHITGRLTLEQLVVESLKPKE